MTTPNAEVRFSENQIAVEINRVQNEERESGRAFREIDRIAETEKG